MADKLAVIYRHRSRKADDKLLDDRSKAFRLAVGTWVLYDLCNTVFATRVS